MKMFCANLSSVYLFAYLPFLGNLLHNTYYVNLPGYSINIYEFKLLIMCYLIKSSVETTDRSLPLFIILPYNSDARPDNNSC